MQHSGAQKSWRESWALNPMYSLAWLVLATGLFIVPAMAFMPRLVFSSKTAIAIPLLSILILHVCKETLWFFSAYNTFSFRLLIALFFVIAVIRLRSEIPVQKFDWSEKDIKCYLFNFLWLLPLLIWYWITPYDTRSDAVTSWDMWAQQHYMGIRPDFFYTLHPYPQAFSVFISNIYTLWGSADYHQLARALFFIFPFCLLTTISLGFLEKIHSVFVPLCISLSAYVLFFFEAFYLTQADTMMAASVLASAYYTLAWKNNKKPEYLLLSAACALLAILTKQHAIFWTFLAWPILLLKAGRGIRERRDVFYAVAVVFSIAALWFFTEGKGLEVFNNQVAIGQSIEDRNLFAQFLYGAVIVFSLFPFTLVLIALLVWLCLYKPDARFICMMFVLPSLLLWIMLGTYSVTRSGIHIIAVMLLIMANDWDWFSSRLPPFIKKFLMMSLPINMSAKMMAVGVVIFFIFAFEVSHYFRQYPLDGGHRNTLVLHNHIASPEKFEEFYYQKGTKMFTQNGMINSIMLRRAEIARPAHGSTELDMLNVIEANGSTTLFPFPPDVDRTPLGRTLDTLAWFCPKLFSPRLKEYDLDIYDIHQDQVENCREILLTRKFFVTPDPVSLY